MKKILRNFIASAVLSAAALTTAHAAIVSGDVTGGTANNNNNGQFQILTTPFVTTGGGSNQFIPNTFNRNRFVFGLNETQNVTLTNTIRTNVGSDALAGQVVNSDMIIFDPRRRRTAEGTITFSSPIIGVITSTAFLLASDSLGLAGVDYNDFRARGLERRRDSVSFTGSTLFFSLAARSPGDFFRVLTVSNLNPSPVPVPAALPFMLTGLIAGAGAIRKRKKSANAVLA